MKLFEFPFKYNHFIKKNWILNLVDKTRFMNVWNLEHYYFVTSCIYVEFKD